MPRSAAAPCIVVGQLPICSKVGPGLCQAGEHRQSLTVLSSAAIAKMSSWSAQLLAHTRFVCFAATGIFLRSLTKYSCRLPLTVPTASTALQADQDNVVTSWACAYTRHSRSPVQATQGCITAKHTPNTSFSPSDLLLAAVRACLVLLKMPSLHAAE